MWHAAGLRLFLRKLKLTLKIPVLALVDSDPYGLKILSVYMKGGTCHDLNTACCIHMHRRQVHLTRNPHAHARCQPLNDTAMPGLHRQRSRGVNDMVLLCVFTSAGSMNMSYDSSNLTTPGALHDSGLRGACQCAAPDTTLLDP